MELKAVFRGLPRFAFYQIQGQSGALYSAAVHNVTQTKAGAVRTYDHRLRPALTLLRQLERRQARQTPYTRIGGLPDVTLERTLSDQVRTDPNKDIVVNAATIEATLRAEPGDGAIGEQDAAEVFGRKEFRLPLKEAQALEQSARLVVDRNIVPPRFYAALAALTTKYVAYYSDRRAKPLADLGAPRAGEEVRIELEQTKLRCERLRSALLENAPPPVHAESAPDELRAFEDWHRQYNRCGHRIRHADMALTTDPAVISDIDRQHRDFLDSLRLDPEAYGFRDAAQLEASLAMSLNELSSSVCHCQQGYFLMDGGGGLVNQLCAKTPTPVTFLCAAGIDFCTDASTLVEGAKYFEQNPEWGHADPIGQKFSRWRPGGEAQLLRRVKSLYRCMFAAAEQKGVTHPCVLPIGLGVFLENVPAVCQDAVKACYFRAQCELLSEKSWGFAAYIMNVGAPAVANFAHAFFEAEGVAARVQAPIVVHTRDLKFVCTALAGANLASAYLNPSDVVAVMQGAIGYYWETGRGTSYVGEEDFAATSTAILGRSNISTVWEDVHRICGIGEDPADAGEHLTEDPGADGQRAADYRALLAKKLERFTGATGGVPPARVWP
eukprot:TRINITY_DN9954_c0_g3_i2.p1 TRINITY_DN9954_c0_g3~~TRINITY_DN9954_c0_g3_i2.p1  ORF type:complete len:688 (+),score=200.90 TRINITY_DN9954_c0_g3_i2:239-2065(+)